MSGEGWQGWVMVIVVSEKMPSEVLQFAPAVNENSSKLIWMQIVTFLRHCSLLDRALRCTVTDQYSTRVGIRSLAVRQL